MTGERSATESSGGEFMVDYDPHTDRLLSVAIVRAVAAVCGEDPAEMYPLYETVDPDVLNDLARQMGGDQNWRFEFTLQEYPVTVKSEGRIVIRDERARE